MTDKIILGAGSHEPIWHRLRTGHASATEWQRWERETSRENLDLLQGMGINRVLVACTKGFGFEAEKPIIERAAALADQCRRRGMQCDIYVQGLPVYYETFLLERPEAAHWLARTQTGEYMPWGGQTFRRWMDSHCEAFLDYQRALIRYAVRTVQPDTVFLDNTVMPGISYTAASLTAFREYLRRKFDGQDPVRLFGIRSFNAVDLPRFDFTYFPPDAMRIVKDPLLQEVSYWRAETYAHWVGQIRDAVKDARPDARFVTACGCDNLRYNALFKDGIDFVAAIRAADLVTMEESGWRPRVFLEDKPSTLQIVMDARSPESSGPTGEGQIRVSTDARWPKILSNFGRKTGFGFWGEFDKVDQEIAAAHGLAFAANANDFGTVGPLAAHERMTDSLRPIIDWAGRHLDLLTGRDERFGAIGLWRGTATCGFVRHTPIWAACAVEQMLFEHHLPFTILLDYDLEQYLTGRRGLILPMTSCVSDPQVAQIRQFVGEGGGLVLLGDAGTRDERTRVRERHAFADLLPADALQRIERIGPPHFVPEVHIGALGAVVRSEFGKGRVSLVPRVTPVRPLDLTRDPYLPWRQVTPPDVQPPANEAEILQEIYWVMGEPAPLHVEGPQYTLCEFWRQGADLLICAANLHPRRDGGPITIHLPGQREQRARIWTLHEDESREVTVSGGRFTIEAVPRFVAARIDGIIRTFGPDRRLAP